MTPENERENESPVERIHKRFHGLLDNMPVVAKFLVLGVLVVIDIVFREEDKTLVERIFNKITFLKIVLASIVTIAVIFWRTGQLPTIDGEESKSTIEQSQEINPLISAYKEHR